MSRLYQLDVEAEGVSEDELRKVLLDEYGWDELSHDQLKGRILFSAEGYLRNLDTEENSHNEIYKSLKAIRPDCRMRTKWTCLDDIPYSVYGDDLDLE